MTTKHVCGLTRSCRTSSKYNERTFLQCKIIRPMGSITPLSADIGLGKSILSIKLVPTTATSTSSDINTDHSFFVFTGARYRICTHDIPATESTNMTTRIIRYPHQPVEVRFHVLRCRVVAWCREVDRISHSPSVSLPR
jgi:hypothetical protein